MDSTILGSADRYQLEGLVAALKTRPVIGFCGAGISVPLRYPTWPQLMEELVDHLELVTQMPIPSDIHLTIRAQRASLPYLAQWVMRRMNKLAYYDFLRTTFTSRADIDFSLEHELLVRLPVRLWMTTNYDLCLTEALSAHLGQNISIEQDIPFSTISGTSSVLPQVVHLHGVATSPESIVLTAEDYINQYKRNPKRTHSLQGLAPFTLFFVGYGLQDHDFNACLELTAALLGLSASTHFALLSKDTNFSQFELDLKSEELRDKGVQPIFYSAPRNDRSSRPEVLKMILKKLNIPEPPPHPEIKLYWSSPDVKIPQIREQLRELRKANLTPSTTFRASSIDGCSVSLSFMSDADRECVRESAKTSHFWTIEPSKATSSEHPIAEDAKTLHYAFFKRDGHLFQSTNNEASSTIDRADIDAEDKEHPSDSGNTLSAKEEHRQMLHALALGVLKTSHDQARFVLEPLVPEQLQFGLADCFHPILDWRFDSPIIHVWLYYEDEQTESSAPKKCLAVTIIGTGLPQIRSEIESAAYIAVLSLPTVQGNIVTRGLIHLSAIEIEEPPVESSGIFKKMTEVFGQRQQLPIPSMPDDARQVIDGLVGILKRLSQETGFVEIHNSTYKAWQSQMTLIRGQLIQLRSRDQVTIIGPKMSDRVVSSFPYPQFPNYLKTPKIELSLSGDLLKSPELMGLLDAYYRNVITRISADLERRIEFYTQELESDRDRVRWFRSLSPEEQAKCPDVTTGRMIDKDLGIDIITTERKVPAREYYLKILPDQIINDEEKELKRLIAYREPIRQIQNIEHPPIWRQCLSRIFDCAIRQVQFCDDPKVNKLFEQWNAIVDGMLRIEWEQCLLKHKIAPHHVFKRTTFFDLIFDEKANQLRIFPNAVIDSARASVIMDPTNGSFLVIDPLDFALNIPDTGGDLDEAKRQVRSMVGIGPDQAIICEQLHQSAFREHMIAKVLCDNITSQRGFPLVGSNERKSALTKAKALTVADRFFRYRSILCFNTAMEILKPEDERHPSAGKALCLAIIECQRAGFEWGPTLLQIYQNRTSHVPPKIVSAFRQALLRNRRMVERLVLDGVIEKDNIELRDAERAAWSIEEVIECIGIAQKFQSVANNLNPDGESQSSAFLKTESAFEGAHGAIFSRLTPSLLRIQKILSCEPLSSEHTG